MAIASMLSAVLFAQAEGGNPMSFLFPFLLIIPMFWLLILRPQKREMMAKAEMLKNLKKNDHVITTSGIYGVVTNVRLEANEVTVRIDENAKLRLTLASIAKVVGANPEAVEAAK